MLKLIGLFNLFYSILTLSEILKTFDIYKFNHIFRLCVGCMD